MNAKKLFKAAYGGMRKEGFNGHLLVIKSYAAMRAAIGREPLHVTAQEFDLMQRCISRADRVMRCRGPGPVPLTLAQRLQIRRGDELDFDYFD